MKKEKTYSPSDFIAMCCPRRGNAHKDRSYNDFLSIARVKPHLSIATKSFSVHLSCSPSTQITCDHRNQITMVLHGEVYNAKDNQAEFLIKQFNKQGLSFSKDINGSFALLLIDPQNDTVALITDRVNSRKVFYSLYKGTSWLSTSLHLHPTTDAKLDLRGLACYLANGVVHNDRTVFDHIRILERACIHKLSRDGFHAINYWSYEFNNSYSNLDEESLRAELSELLVESVKIRLDDDSKVFLSLSGGYDATTILGILSSKLKLPEVSCFSYALGEPRSNNDAHVSKEMANCLGYGHRIVRSYKGNLLDTLGHNADLGQGLANFCDEVDAWLEMGTEFSASKSSILLVADECFGWTDCELNSNIDVLESVSIYDFNGLHWLRNRLSEGVYRTLYEALEQDISYMLRRCPPSEDYHDAKDFLYLDQRLNNVILQWREFFAGKFIIVRNPFLDNAIIDFMTRIPSSLRRGKRLYIETVTQMFPQLFRIERATTDSYAPNWKQEFRCNRHAIKKLVLSQDSKLDTIIPPEVILKLLKDKKTWHTSRFSARTLPFKVARRLLTGTPKGKRILAHFTKIPRIVVDPTTFLKRVLVLRLFLSKVSKSENKKSRITF